MLRVRDRLAREAPVLMVGVSALIRGIEDELDHVVCSDAGVLLTGEHGVGKTLVARLIHQRSPRAAAPFVTVSCANLPEAVLASQVFGCVKGVKIPHDHKRGRLEAVHGGTLFLREVGEMSLRMQAKLLRFLETGEIERAGSVRHLPSLDVRVIAATSRRLLDAVADRTFREDLYYRLNVVHIEIPPLRERREDVPVLVQHFLRELAEARGLSVPELTAEAVAHLMAYRWPDNVRELKKVAERLAFNCRTGRIDVEMLPSAIMRTGDKAAGTHTSAPRSEMSVHEELFARIVQGTDSFWSGVYEPFMARDLTRNDVRAIIRLGLKLTNGNYERLAESFKLAPRDYKRFIGFLRKHHCHMPFRSFRTAPARFRPRSIRPSRASA